MKGAMADAIPARMAEEGVVFGRMLRAPEAREAFTDIARFFGRYRGR